MGEKGYFYHGPLPEVSPKQLLECVELLPDYGGEPGGVALEDQNEHVNLPEIPDHIPYLPGEQAAPVKGLLDKQVL